MRTRLDRARDRRDDAQHELDKWGWSLLPSQVRAQERKIARLAARVQRLEER